ncbi:MAG: pyridoxamine kinase [Dehalococcoidia bacterium]|nr:pyridoxamine kinase [Dehalococcoidia bacterium]
MTTARQKRVLAIHDISCVGRCSLTVAQPIISAAGIETSVIPTAVLSTHTGGFINYTFHDLTDEIMPIVEHWETLNLQFDAIYSGYLGSLRQIDIISQVFAKLKSNNTTVIVDPVMADNGALYSHFPTEFPLYMRNLIGQADVIIPNMTEALLLLGEDYVSGPYTEVFIKGVLKRLAALGPQEVVLTGVYFDDKMLGAASYNDKTSAVDFAMQEYIPGSVHGTGDVFGSVLVASMVHGFSLPKSCSLAACFTVDSIKRTQAAQTDVKYGVNFEDGLADFARLIKNT